MAFCGSCGAQVGDGLAFCPKCGAAQAANPGAGATPSAAVTPTAASAAAPTVSNPGMTNNVAGALAYFLTFLTGILFLVLEPYNKDRFVRFHAFQAIFFGVTVCGFWIIFSFLWTSLFFGGVGFFFLLWRLIQLIEFAFFLCWLFLMYKAYNKEEFKLPILGALAEKQAGK
jgi:uncharacterized membrane protein